MLWLFIGSLTPSAFFIQLFVFDRYVSSTNSVSLVTHSPSPLPLPPLDKDLVPCTRFDCSNHGNCLGTKGRLLCFCDAGHVGERCTEPLCNSLHACNGHGICVGTRSNFHCLCQLGYTGNRCQRVIDVGGVVAAKWPLMVATATGNDSFDSASNAVGKYRLAPARLNTCGAADCSNRGVCVGDEKIQTCLCYLGFNGFRCENSIFAVATLLERRQLNPLDDSTQLGQLQSSTLQPSLPCDPEDCSSRGVCLGTRSHPHCLCQLGYEGRRCERELFPICSPADCSYRGLCLGNKRAYTCACHTAFIGERCERTEAGATVCDTSDCSGRGVCLGTKNIFTCLCNLGYSGRRCENRLGPVEGLALTHATACDLKDCNMNGVCIGSRLAPVCICNLGYSGPRCEIEPPCLSELQCSANGICFGTQKLHVCLCNSGWAGVNCQYFTGT